MADVVPDSQLLYEKLSHARQEIRLLSLAPGRLDDQPRCDIKVVSLQHELNFVALSYVWGDETNRKEILLRGHPFSVTANLEEALRYVQQIQCSSPIWIDALCIHQADPEEKGQQVALMADIYSRACTTYMWIGPPVYFSNVAMDSIKKIQQIPSSSWINARIYAVKQLINRPYWTRVWVIQEAFYSKHAIVKCGNDEVDFDFFYDLQDFIKFHNRRPLTDKCPENPDQNLIKFPKFPFGLLFNLCPRNRLKEAPIRIDLFRWLNYSDSFSSTLPRDRIFAFLNLAFVTDKKSIQVDYSTKSTNRQIFSKATAYIMKSRQPTQYLLPLQLRQVGKLLDLPSWVSDWTIPPYHATITTSPKASQYSAGQDDSMWLKLCPNTVSLGVDILNNPVQFSFSEDFETLILRGIVVDKIIYAISIADGNELVRQFGFKNKSWALTQREILNACRAWEVKAFSSPRNAYDSAAGLEDAIWRTIILNKYPDGTSPPSPDYGACFMKWKRKIENEETFSDDPEVSEFDRHFVPGLELRAFCLTEKGRVGLVPSGAQDGDLVCIFPDGRIPFVNTNAGTCCK